MTPAELKTIRESLGLTAQWIADHAGVKLRTAQYWEAGRMAVPDDVVAMLGRIDQMLNSTVEQAVTHIDDMSDQHSEPSDVVLLRYRTDADLWRFRPDMKSLPTTTHAAMLARLRRALWRRGIKTNIEYMEPEEYLTWLGKRKDSEAERAAWAARKDK